MWEEYLIRATSGITNKYRARRIQARLRRQILTYREKFLAEGIMGPRALDLALEKMGDPDALAQRLAWEERQQHGWLWMVACLQILLGIGLLVFSSRSEYFAGISLGRLLALGGVAVTGFQRRQIPEIRLWIRLKKPRFHLRAITSAVIVGGLSGTGGALLTAAPWEILEGNAYFPVIAVQLVMLGLALAIIWIPLAMTSTRMVHRLSIQIWAGFAAMASYTGILTGYPGLVPPPFFNWIPALLAIGSFGFYFWAIRLYLFVRSLKGGAGEDPMGVS